jgi:hypothetical protein
MMATFKGRRKESGVPEPRRNAAAAAAGMQAAWRRNKRRLNSLGLGSCEVTLAA